MKVTKLASTALLLTIGAAMFVGCGKKDKVDPNAPVTINLWYGAAVTEAGPPPADWKALKIIKEKFNIDLVLTALPSAENDQDQKINAAGAANELPDLFMVRRPVWQRLVEQGLIADVDDMYAKMPNRVTHYDSDSKAFTTINGKSYGLASPGSIAKNEGLLIRKDWLDKLGLKEPKTLDELFNVMKAFTFNDPDGNGKNDTYGYGAFVEIQSDAEGLGRRLEPIMGAFGVAGTWSLHKEAPGLKVFNPAYYDALTFVKKMCDEKVIDPNWLSYKKDDFRAAWKQGKFGIFREQNAAYAAKNNYAPFDKNFPQGSFIINDAPKGPNGKSAIGVYTKAYRIYAVSAAAAEKGKKDKIAELLNWMSSDEGYYLLGWGEEGVNFNKNAEGVPETKTLADPAKAWDKGENVSLTQLRNMVFYNGGVEIKARYPAYTTDVSKKTMSAGTALTEMQSKEWEPCIGCDTLPAPNADVKRFLEQGVLEFLTGKRELTKDNWNAWVDEFKKVGGQAWNDAGVEAAKKNGILY